MRLKFMVGLAAALALGCEGSGFYAFECAAAEPECCIWDGASAEPDCSPAALAPDGAGGRGVPACVSDDGDVAELGRVRCSQDVLPGDGWNPECPAGMHPECLYVREAP